jgi:hypothetical protein
VLSYVVVVRKPGRNLPAHVLAYLQKDDVDELCFIPEAHEYWADRSHSVAFAGWQNLTDIATVGSHWHRDEHGLIAFSGRMWPKGRMWLSDDSWAHQLACHSRTHSLVESGQPFDGLYTAASLSASGAGVIVTDPCSVAMLYRAENDDVVAFATSAGLAARVTSTPGHEPDRDPLGTAWLPLLGYFVGDRTGFVGTNVLPLGSYVEIDPAYGSRLRFSNATPWAPESGLAPVEQHDLIDLVHHDLLESVQSIADLPASPKFADLTGGRDSRLILATMLEAGVADRFTFRTRGTEHTPDSIVGRMIAQRLQLQQEAVAITALDDPIGLHRRLHTHVFQTSGMTSAWDLQGTLGIATTPSVTGFVGEILRTNFKSYPTSLGALGHVFHSRAPIDRLSIVQPDVRSKLVEVLDAELLERVEAGGSTQDRLDTFYVRHRLRRWFGTAQELGHLGRVFPLYQLRGLQAAFALGPTNRANELVPFAIMRAACPELAKVPLADAGWNEAVLSDLPDADNYRTPPVNLPPDAPVQPQPQRLEHNRELLEGYLLDEPSSPIYDIVDRDAIMSALRGPLPDHTASRQLFGALTAAVWLGHHESRYRIGGDWDQLPGALEPKVATKSSPLRPGLFKRVRHRITSHSATQR